MLYTHKKQYPLPGLPEMHDLDIKETDDAFLMSILGKITVQQATRRLANDNKAFVAYYKNIPAAFGWMAMGKAKVGELNHEIILPLNHRYLWNFRTLEEFRGLGIYPRVLQFVLRTGYATADCFWILHAPENAASEKGIVKAGFRFAGHVSVLKNNHVVFDAVGEGGDVPQSLGFDPSDEEQAMCWKCSSPYLKHKKTDCCCESVGKECNQELFIA